MTTSSVSSSLDAHLSALRRVRRLTLTTWHSVPDDDEHDDDDDDEQEDEEDDDEHDDDDPKGSEQSKEVVSKQLDSDEMLDGTHADVMLDDSAQRHGFHPQAVHSGSPTPPPQMHRSRRHTLHQRPS